MVGPAEDPEALLGALLPPETSAWTGRIARAVDATSPAALELACRTNAIRDLGEGAARVQQKVLGRLLRGGGWGDVRLLDAARRTAVRVLDRLGREPSALRLVTTGALRRMAPVVGRVDLLATAHDAEALLEAFTTLPTVAAVTARQDDAAEVRLDEGMRVRLEVVADEAFAARHLWRTGPEAHVEALVGRAAARALRLDEDGLWREGARLPLDDEAALYAALGLAPVAPERREDPRALASVERGEDAALVAMADVQGLVGLHVRTGAGAFAAEVMAERAAREGYRWAVVLGDLPPPEERPEDLALFRGALVAVDEDGALLADGADLAGADLVVARVAGRGEPTRRMLAAVEDPRVDALHLPPGEGVLLGRGGEPWDVAAVLDACARRGVALAPSALPHRRTLDLAFHEAALARNLLLLPFADAHDLDGVDQGLWGTADARRGGWPQDRVLTTRDAAGFLAWREGRRRS